nr:unnamed protein product [Callosobruchus chinensis]
MMCIVEVKSKGVAQRASKSKSRRTSVSSRIVGGVPVTIADYPYQLSLRFSGSHTCGASILSSRFALTAGHCTLGLIPDVLTVRAGSSFRNRGGQVIQVSRVYIHQNFSYATMDYDVSILELATDIQFSEAAAPVALIGRNLAYPQGTLAVISGWGTVREGALALPTRLRASAVPLVSRRSCFLIYRGRVRITNRMICAGLAVGGRDTCQGTQGGLLLSMDIKSESSHGELDVQGLTSLVYIQMWLP